MHNILPILCGDSHIDVHKYVGWNIWRISWYTLRNLNNCRLNLGCALSLLLISFIMASHHVPKATTLPMWLLSVSSISIATLTKRFFTNCNDFLRGSFCNYSYCGNCSLFYRTTIYKFYIEEVIVYNIYKYAFSNYAINYVRVQLFIGRYFLFAKSSYFLTCE